MNDAVIIWCWLAVTAAHMVQSIRAANRLLPDDGDRDRRLFNATLFGVGGLLVALHTAALTVGATLAGTAAILSVWHTALWLLARRLPTPFRMPPWSWPERAAIAVGSAILLGWIQFAFGSAEIVGTDAAHYHVPNAVNLALGVSPMSLPATPHLYPVAASMAAAWFVGPLGDPLLIDLAMCLPFLLVITAVNVLFREATGLSGLGWASWFGLLMFSTPLFRISSFVSADLWFAAGVLALAATLARPIVRRSWRLSDIALTALATGLLAGSKATGTVAIVLVLGASVPFALVRRPIGLKQPPIGVIAATACLGAILFLGAGGIWLIRNWVLFGSPLAPYGVEVFGIGLFQGEPMAPTTYLSVLGDLEKQPEYSLSDRAMHYMRLWLGKWFVTLLLPGVLLPCDLLYTAFRRRKTAEPRLIVSRWYVLTLAGGVGAVLTWTMLGAPWTSLEWTRGLSLRYLLPALVAVALAAFIALFPLNVRWYDDADAATALNGLLAVFAVAVAVRAGASTSVRSYGVPPVTIPWLAAGMALVGAAMAMSRWSSRTRAVAYATALLVSLTGASGIVAGRVHEGRLNRATSEAGEQRAFASGQMPQGWPREVYLAARADELLRGHSCDARRFISLIRLDEPLLLQDAEWRTRVFYGGRDLAPTAAEGPIGRCDYVITSAGLAATVKGVALVNALARGAPLHQVRDSKQFVLLTADR